jgi:hypothetical protein
MTTADSNTNKIQRNYFCGWHMQLNKDRKYVITVERLKNNMISSRDADE